MTLKVSVLLIAASVIGSVLSASIDCNIEQCAKPQKLYEELGCKAVYGSKSCCPKRFECPDFRKLDEDKCTLGGRQYSIGDILPRNFTDDSKCVETCICTREGNDPAKFTCTNSDCGVSSFKVPGCINVYGDLNECCSTSIVCDEAEKKTLASCFVEQTEFREGEKFIPTSNKCYECLCHRDFDNTTITDNPHCRKLNCEIDLRYKSFVQRGCLPVFHSGKCCPVDFECPTNGKKINKRSASDDETQTAKQDVFIVTPSKNLEEYLSEVKLSNEHGLLDVAATSQTTTITTTTQSVTSETVAQSSSSVFQTTETSLETTSTSAPTSQSHVIIPITLHIEEEPKLAGVRLIDTQASTVASTTVELPAIIVEVTTPAAASASQTESSTFAFEASTKSFEASTTKIETTTEAVKSTAETTVSKAETTVVPSTSEKIPEIAVETRTPPTTTITSTSTAKPEESEEDEVEEDENTNLFGEEVEKSTEIPSSTEGSTLVVKASTIAIETSSAMLTTEALRELLRVLDQPENLTTLPPVASQILDSTTQAVDSTTTTTTSQPLTTIAHESSTSAVSVEATVTQTTTVEPPSSIVSVVQETTSTTEAPATTTTAQTPSENYFDNIFPTAFDKLLSTVKDFVAQADAATSTEAPKPSTTASSSQLEQKVEFVNFTVSEMHNEETKVIVKRSAPAADLIPLYYKEHALSLKDKSCLFNGKSFKVGEIIQTDNDCLKCHCEYAPIGHCVLKEKCNL